MVGCEMFYLMILLGYFVNSLHFVGVYCYLLGFLAATIINIYFSSSFSQI